MAWLYKQKGSNNWWIGYRVNGKQFYHTTGTRDRNKAEQQLAKVHSMFESHRAGMLDQVYQALSGKLLPNHALKAAVESWIKECSTTTAESTFDKYASILSQFCNSLGAGPEKPKLTEVTAEQIRSFLQDRREKRSANTINIERKILSIFFGWCVSNSLLRDNPIVAVKRFKTGSKEQVLSRRHFTLKELEMIYGKAPSPFWRYMIVGGFYTGLRLGDLITLSWEAIDFGQRKIHLLTRKTSKTVHPPLRPEFETVLRELHSNAGKPKKGAIWEEQASRYQQSGSGPFSNEFYDDILAPCGLVPVRTKKKEKNGRANQRQINPVSFHCLRHSFVTFLKLTSGNQAVAKELAGHSSDLVSDLYTHIPEQELRNAIKALPEITSQQTQMSLDS